MSQAKAAARGNGVGTLTVGALIVETVPTNLHLFELSVLGQCADQRIQNTFYAICLDQATPPATGQPILGTIAEAMQSLYRLWVLKLLPTDYSVRLYKLKNIYGGELYVPEGNDPEDTRFRPLYGQVHDLEGDAVLDAGDLVGDRMPTYTGAHITTKSTISAREWVGGLRTPPLLRTEVTNDTITLGTRQTLDANYRQFLTTPFAVNAVGGTGVCVHFSRKYASENLEVTPSLWSTGYVHIASAQTYTHQISRRRSLHPDL